MTLAFAARMRPMSHDAPVLSTGRRYIARSKKGKIAPREARAENMVDIATCTQSDSCGSCNGWNLLTIPVSSSKASLKKMESADYSSHFFSKDSIIPWNLLAHFFFKWGQFSSSTARIIYKGQGVSFPTSALLSLSSHPPYHLFINTKLTLKKIGASETCT